MSQELKDICTNIVRFVIALFVALLFWIGAGSINLPHEIQAGITIAVFIIVIVITK